MLQNIISRLFGSFANTKFPKSIQELINKSYAGIFNIDFSEHEPVSSYESLVALFTRKLKAQRQLEADFISPCDGALLYSGKGFENQAFCIKHHTYDVLELLSKACEKSELENGFDYAGIYLSPRDYHRFHAPCDFSLESLCYESGALYSVSPKTLSFVDNLYAKNERVILRCALPNGKLFWLVFVGALNVGKIRIERESRIQTNAGLSSAFYTYENESFSKGEELGCFEMGSSIVIIAQSGAFNFTCTKEQKLRFGLKIAEFL